MTTLTKLVLRSGDRHALEDVVEELRIDAQRKGAQLTGPHSDPPIEHAVPLYKCLDGTADETFGRWSYTVYSRRFEIAGHDGLVRRLLDREFPEAVQLEVEIEQVGDAGQ